MRVFMFLAVLFFAGCSSKKESPVVVVATSEKDTGTPKIDVPELLKHHERFRGREVELTGWATRDDFPHDVTFWRPIPGVKDAYSLVLAEFSVEEYAKVKGELPRIEDRKRREIVITGTVGTEDKGGGIRVRDCRFVKALSPKD